MSLKNDLSDKSDAELVALFNSLRGTSETALYDACVVIAELSRRGKLRPEWRQGVYRHYELVVSGALHPRIALVMSESPTMIAAFRGMPLETQARLVDGESVVVAVLNRAGVVIAEDQTLAQMQPSVFPRVFGLGIVRSFDDQKKMILARQESARAARSPKLSIRVDKVKQEVVIGQVRVPAMDLVLALIQLGFRVEKNPADEAGA